MNIIYNKCNCKQWKLVRLEIINDKILDVPQDGTIALCIFDCRPYLSAVG